MRVVRAAAAGVRQNGLRHSGALRGRAGPGAAAVDGAPGCALSGAAPSRYQFGCLPAPAAGQARGHPEPAGGAAGSAAGNVQALWRAHRYGDLRDRSRHPRGPVRLGAAAGASGPVPGVSSNPSLEGITARLWRAAFVATSARTTPQPPGSLRWSSSCRSGISTAPARAWTFAAAERTAWPTRASRCPCSVPWIASFPRRRASWPTSCGWRPCDHRKGVLDGCPTWGEASTPSLPGRGGAGPVAALQVEPRRHSARRPALPVLERMEQNWPEGEEHCAKLAINAWWVCSLGI